MRTSSWRSGPGRTSTQRDLRGVRLLTVTGSVRWAPRGRGCTGWRSRTAPPPGAPRRPGRPPPRREQARELLVTEQRPQFASHPDRQTPLRETARATRTVSAGISPSPSGRTDIGTLPKRRRLPRPQPGLGSRRHARARINQQHPRVRGAGPDSCPRWLPARFRGSAEDGPGLGPVRRVPGRLVHRVVQLPVREERPVLAQGLVDVNYAAYAIQRSRNGGSTFCSTRRSNSCSSRVSVSSASANPAWRIFTVDVMLSASW